VAALVGAGCAYESQYVAPRDGKPRAVWRGNHVEVDHGGVPPTDACLAQIAWETATDRIQLADGARAVMVPQQPPYAWRPSAAFWVPIWWGLPPPAPVAGFAPPLPAPPLFLAPPIARRLSLAPVASWPAPSVRPAAGGPGVVGAPGVRLRAGGSGGSGGSSGSSGSGELGKGAVYLAIVALVVMPIVDVALAVAPAESVSASVRGIDQANALIDLSRVPGSPCAPEALDGWRAPGVAE
jgi:hypothetical protein